MKDAELVIYGRPGCHLCDEAREEIDRMAREGGWRLTVREVNIEDDEGLLRRYLERIPVVEVQGEEVSELVLDGEALARRIATVGADG